MEVFNMEVNLSMREAMDIIRDEIEESISGECIDTYHIKEEGGSFSVAVFEKYFYRAGNRLTFTVVMDNFNGLTRIHGVGGGGSSGIFFRFDWGAANTFATGIERALKQYEVIGRHADRGGR